MNRARSDHDTALPTGAPAADSIPLPTALLTGFLGSGKTSFLRRVLADPAAQDTAVLINEFGEVGLDHLIVDATRPGDVVQLPNGCMCCAVKQDLAQALHRLLTGRANGSLPAFHRVVIETSGLAEPAPILYTLAADAYLEHTLRCHHVIAVIDSLLGLVTLDRFAEATAQIACADALLISKTDLEPLSPTLRQRLEAMNPTASILDSQAVPSPMALLFAAAGSVYKPRRWAAADHTSGIATHAVVLHAAMSRLEFAMALAGLARERGNDLLRVKGLVEFSDRPGRPAAMHAVQHTLYPPHWLEAWPDEDTTQRLVFIVRGIAPDDILRRFSAGAPELLA